MDLGLRGKTALVQGASAGIGHAIAGALSCEGMRVAICSRDEARIRKAVTQVAASAAFACDLSRPGGGKESVERAARELGGPIDVLVINTGGPPRGPFQTITAAQWQEGFAGLWMSAVESMNAALPAMRARRWGRILLVTSAAAREPMDGLTVSNGLRAGLLGLVHSIAREVAVDGVTINALLPGYTDTERLRELGIPAEKIVAQIPAGRLGKPEELGALAAFLASGPAAYVTGQAIVCDGGYLKGY